MKQTKLTKKIDDLGRIVIPVELRSALGIMHQDELEMHIDGGSIILTKKQKGCVLCESTENLSEAKNGKYICIDCLDHLH
jgi:transcriptional pleiotropic regulator of transition state genes